MPAAAEPADEAERLAALASLHVMDSGSDARFDSFVRLAADLFGVPIALVSLVDRTRQWFKARQGLDAKQTPRDFAFCAHAILQPDEVMVVEDATLDPRFSDNPLVRGEPFIRFYAGAIIRAPSGHPLGTLCVIDQAPRRFSAGDRARLRHLAAGVSALLDLHRITVELRRAATHDPLTSLANRALFDQRLDLAIADALTGRPCALLLLDLDRFKQVNDLLGHKAGDMLLREVAGRLKSAVRSGDLVARLGGDEFAVLMTDPADGASAAALAARIQEVLEAPVLIAGEAVPLQASIGIALCPLDAAGPGPLLRAADQALYQVKRQAFGTAGEAWAARAAERPAGSGHLLHGAGLTGRELNADLQTAMQTGALRLAWQPVFATTSLTICGYEALQRWTRPGHGPVAPGVFIPFAEASGLIAGMDTWTMDRACAAVAAWPEHLRVSVNLSAHWFGGADVFDLVANALARSGVAPHRLCVEITERTVIANREVARIQIDALRGLGVRVALDDFGTGFSSLAYLRDLPFDEIKLDRSFVAALGDSERSDAVACAIIDLGHRLGMKVCAEGVETQAQLDLLTREGCDLVQGYLLGRPGPEPLALP